MKLKNKLLIYTAVVLGAVALVTGCSGAKTPYDQNDEENYSVSVKFDANGGVFTTDTSVIVDSYKLEDLPVGTNGKAQIALLAPDDERRGVTNAFFPAKNGYFLAGWYTERTEVMDENGNPTYIYGNRWDFETGLLEVDKDKTYSASEPVVTLYAAWVPMFEVQYYSKETGEVVSTYKFNPLTDGNEIVLPAWDMETGRIKMNDVPGYEGYTYQNAYYDEACKELITDESLMHPGVLDTANGVGKNSVLKVYVDWKEGDWYRIYNVEQFLDNAGVGGSYEILADLDFTDQVWPTALLHGNYKGTIEGNGHTFSNITFEQRDNQKRYAGLFGYLTESASINDVHFENVTFTIEKGTRVNDVYYGLLIGAVAKGATVNNVTIQNGILQIDSSARLDHYTYAIGLVCGTGPITGISADDISCVATGKNPETVIITVEGEKVTVGKTE